MTLPYPIFWKTACYVKEKSNNGIIHAAQESPIDN